MSSARPLRKCAVCGDTPAKIHYGVLACFGCKGFFRRAVKDGRNKYVCRFENDCQVNKSERNSCRYCRFRRCLLVGMNPDFVRPDREEKKVKEKSLKSLGRLKSLSRMNSNKQQSDSDNWTMLLTPAQRQLLSNLNNIESQTQSIDANYESIAQFSLKSLIADRKLARMSQSSESRSPRSGADLMSIDRIIRVIDFVDVWLSGLENENMKRVSVEDKCALISDSFLPLSILDSIALLCASQSTNFSEDFTKNHNLKTLDFSFLARFNNLCERFKKKPISPTEFVIVRALLVCCGDSSLLSNVLGEELGKSRELLQELLFRVSKFSRKISSSQAAVHMGNAISLVYEIKTLSTGLHDCLSQIYPQNNSTTFPFHKIISDILHPEVSDLVAELCRSRSQSTTVPTITFSPPSLHVNEATAIQDTPTTSAFLPCPNPPEHSFTAPRLVRPTALGFCSKLPLTLTKSIEEMLRAPGMGDDVMNRPLSKDWADGFRLTPVFNRDVVAHFFPELSGTNV